VAASSYSPPEEHTLDTASIIVAVLVLGLAGCAVAFFVWQAKAEDEEKKEAAQKGE